MSKQIISTGSAANDKTGDNLRNTAGKINSNFSELYSALGNGSTLTVSAVVKSGSYNDLLNKPVVPTNTNQLTNGAGFITLQDIPGNSGNSLINGDLQLELDINGNTSLPGTLSFPDGTIQTTAYTGEANISKFVAVNLTGVISGSDDGITWTDYQSTLNSIDRVAVGPNKIVYLADSSTDNDKESLWYADTYDTAPTEVSSIATRGFVEVKYFKSISKFIAVGDDGATPRNPALYYSDDGITWTTKTIDSTYLSTFESYTGDVGFVAIEENELGFFVISGSAYVGGFFLTDITDTLDGNNHVDLSTFTTDPDEVVYTNSYYFTGWHIITGGDGIDWYYNSQANPTTGTFEGDWIDITSLMEQEIGISSGISEVVVGDVYGMSTVMISTPDGQIIYWPAVPAGPYVSIPKPYTATITEWTSSATSTITYTGSIGNGNGEKFTVTGSSVTSYNGTYYLGSNNAIFTDVGLITPLDTTGFDPFTGTATITWSHGQYIDALHYNNGIFYAGNDDEELFTSSNGGQTWTQVDTLLPGSGESFLNDIDSYITNPGLITFNGVQIRGVASEGKTGLIKLVPSTGIEGYSFLDNGQFVQIYPTNNYDAPHIHIAAGIGGASEGDIFLGDDNKHLQVNHNGQVSIQTYYSETNNTYNWRFNTDGSIDLPYLLTNIHNGGEQWGQTLKFGVPGQQVIITGPTPDTNVNAERLIIQGQRGLGTGEGGDVYLWAGDAEGTNGGDIKIYAGDADQLDAGYGGYVNIDGGNGFNQGGGVSITGGNSPGGTGGTVSIMSGSGSTSTDNGLVTIQVGSYYWQFTNTGALVVPSGGDIKDSSGNSVLNTSGISNDLLLAQQPSYTSNIVNIDFSKAVTKIVLDANVTNFTYSNLPSSMKTVSTIIIFVQDSSGNKTINGDYLTQDNAGLDIDYTPNSTSIVSFLAVNEGSTSVVYAFSNGTNFS